MIWHRQFEEAKGWLQEGEKVIIKGRAKMEEDKDGKVFCSEIRRFEGNGRKLGILFPSVEEYVAVSVKLQSILRASKGTDEVYIVASTPGSDKKLRKKLENTYVNANSELVSKLKEMFGEDCVKVIE